MGFFNDPNALLHAAEEAAGEGFRDMDAYSPFPIHGIEEILRIKRSWIPTASLVALFVGAGLGWLLQYWTHRIDWPINIGGKPLVSWPPYIIIVFECAVLLSALTNFLCMFIGCKLYPNPVTKPIDKELTNDRFALVIPLRRGNNEAKAAELLQRVGADEIRKVGI